MEISALHIQKEILQVLYILTNPLEEKELFFWVCVT